MLDPVDTTGSPARAIALRLALTVLGVYLLTAGLHTYSPDEEERYYVARGLLEQRTLAVAIPTQREAVVAGERLVDGRNYSKYGLGGSLVAVPFYLLGAGLARLTTSQHELITRAALGLIDPLATATTAGPLVVLCAGLGYRPRLGAAIAGLYALGTFAWVYARTTFVEPLVGLSLLAALLALHRWRGAQNGSLRRPLLAGGWLGLAVLCRLDSVLLLPWYGLYLLAPAGGSPNVLSGPRDPQGIRPSSTWRRWLAGMRRSVPAVVTLACGPLLALVLTATYNAARFGSPFETGYGAEASRFDTPFLLGLVGLLASPGRGLLLYASPVLLAVLGWRRFVARHPTEGWMVLALAATSLGFFARWSSWHGGGGYGPRLLLPVLAPLLLPAVAYLDALRGPALAVRWSRRLRLAVVALVLAVAAWTVPAGVLVNFGAVINAADAPGERALLWDPRALPVNAHWRFAADAVGFWWAFARQDGPRAIIHEGLEIAPAGRQGDYLPAWTGPQLRLVLPTADRGAHRLDVVYDEHRPPQAPASNLRGWFDGRQATIAAGERDGHRLLTLEAAPSHAARPPSVTLVADPWVETGIDWHPEPLVRGIHLVSLELDGTPLTPLAVRPPVPPMGPRLLFLWFHHPGYHHLDVWPWLAVVAGYPAVAVGAIAVALLIATAAAAFALHRALRAAT